MLLSRGTKPRAYDPWQEHEQAEGDTFETLLSNFLVWKKQGQHVRLEWVPDGAYEPRATHFKKDKN